MYPLIFNYLLCLQELWNETPHPASWCCKLFQGIQTTPSCAECPERHHCDWGKPIFNKRPLLFSSNLIVYRGNSYLKVCIHERRIKYFLVMGTMDLWSNASCIGLGDREFESHHCHWLSCHSHGLSLSSSDKTGKQSICKRNEKKYPTSLTPLEMEPTRSKCEM